MTAEHRHWVKDVCIDNLCICLVRIGGREFMSRGAK